MGEGTIYTTSPFAAGLKCRCPRCGKGKLFEGFLTIAPACTACGRDFSKLDSGDGPAVFVILILGFIVIGGALALEIAFAPPYWVHFVLWIPLTIIGVFVMLPPFKATLIALQYKHRAAEGRLDE